jgi:hypothetical protein
MPKSAIVTGWIAIGVFQILEALAMLLLESKPRTPLDMIVGGMGCWFCACAWTWFQPLILRGKMHVSKGWHWVREPWRDTTQLS